MDAQTRPSAIAASQFDYILLDGSGSMQSKWWETLAALDSYVSQLKAEKINSHMKLVVFDTQGHNQDINYYIHRDAPLDSCPLFNAEPIGSTWGSTPLYDAIEVMGQDLEQLAPSSCSILIITDGDENASHVADLSRAKCVLDYLRSKGYQITFMGADFNNSAQAKALGANEATAIGVQKKLLSDATKSFAKKRANYARFGTDINFTKDEQQQFGGFLPPPRND